MASITTIKLDADISGLKKGIQDANRQIRLANAEFKAASSGMENWSKSSDGINSKLKQLNTVLGNQKAILKSYEAQLKLVVEEQGENSKGADDLRIKIANQQAVVNKTTAEITKYKGELDKLETEQNQAATAAEKTENAYDDLQSEIKEQESELKKLKSQYSNVVLEQGEGSDAAKDLASKIDNLSNKLQDNKTKLKDAEEAADKFDNSLEDLGDEADKTSNGGLSVFSVALGNLISNVVSNAISKMKDLVTETINVGKTFDSSMSKVGAISGATGKDLDALRNKAKEMGSTTKFTASQSAEAFNYMAMAGWNTEDMLDGIEGVLNLAAASGSDLATTSDIVTDALTAMGYSAKDSGKLADVMAAASSNANTNVEMMGKTFQYAAPIVGAMGYSMEDTAEQIGLMANAGIKGEKAGTALRSILTRLAAPPKEAATAMDALGISLTDSEGNMKSLDQVMAELRKAFGGLSETQQTQYAKSIAGQEAMSGLLAIVNAAPTDVDKLSNAINNSNGAAKDMADTMMDNLGGDLTTLGSKFEGVQLALYEKFEPALRSGVDALDKILNAIDFVIKHLDTFTTVISTAATVVGTFLLVLNWGAICAAAANAITAVKLAVIGFNATLAANPIALVIALIAGLIVAFINLWKKSEAFRNFWIGLWEKIKSVTSVAWQAISEFFLGAWEALKSAWSNLVTFFSTLWEGIKAIFTPIAQWINDNVFAPIKAFFQPLVNFFITSWNIIKELAVGTLEAIKLIWGAVTSWFNKKIIIPVKKYFSDLWSGIKDKAKATWTTIKNVWSIVSGWFNSVIIIPVKTAFTGLWDKLKSGAKNAWSGIKSVFSPVVNWFKDKFTKAWQAVKDVFSTGGKIFDGIKEGIVSAFKTVVNAIIKGINKVIAVPFNAINNTLDKIKNVKIGPAKPFKKLISRFDIPEIPTLATGGVLAKGQLGLLEGNGAEAVVPLERNKKWIAKTANDLKASLEAEGILGAGSANNITNNNYTFNQTNNSPKALSRLEIYRQTKNQIAFAKGV